MHKLCMKLSTYIETMCDNKCTSVFAEHSRVSRDFNNSYVIRRSKTWKMSTNTTVFGLIDAHLLANITLFT